MYLLRTSLKAHDFYFVPSATAGNGKEDYDSCLGGSMREEGDDDGDDDVTDYDNDNGGRIMNDATHTLQRCFLHHANSDTDTITDTATEIDTATVTPTNHATNDTTTNHATNNTNTTTATTATTTQPTKTTSSNNNNNNNKIITLSWWTSLLSKQDPFLPSFNSIRRRKTRTNVPREKNWINF